MNDLSIMGRLVDYPELRKTSSGISTTTFRIACERDYVKQGEERATDFFDVVAWRGTAEFACKWLSKGSVVAISGSIQSRSWVGKDEKKRTVTEIQANKLHFADSARPNTREDESAIDIDPDPADFELIDESEDLPF